MARRTTTTTTTPMTVAERKAQLLAELAEIEAAEAAEARAQEQVQQQRAAIAQVAVCQLRPRYQALLAQAVAVEEQIAQAMEAIRVTQPQPQPSTQPQPAGKPNHYPMKFFGAFTTKHKGTGVTQRVLTARCRAARIDQSDRSAENLQRAYDALKKAGEIA
jgi:hypothetical protein